MSEENPVKKELFDYIESIPKDAVKEAIENNNTSNLVRQIISNTVDKIDALGNSSENRAILATGILHFFLTNMMITSQRKIEYDSQQLDIIIPNLKDLLENPKTSLVIIISDSKDPNYLCKRIAKIGTMQPISKNIWCVLTKDMPIDCKKFVVGDKSFEHILEEINGFVVQNNTNSKLKIFKN